METKLEETELENLEINIDWISVNETDGLIMHKLGPYYGAYTFKYKYPINDNEQYNINEIRRICYRFKFDDNSLIPTAIIEIKFDKFELENGFDRVLIRHFNDSFIDLPKSYTGYHENLTIQYYSKNTSKSICIEFQSDDSISNKELNIDQYPL